MAKIGPEAPAGRRETKAKERPLVFIAHQVSGDVEKNLESAARWVRWAILKADVWAVAPYIGLCAALDDADVDERTIGIDISLEVLKRCDELWLCGHVVSSGMQIERDFAHGRGIPVKRFDGPYRLY